MLKRKVTTPKSASPSSRRSDKPAKAPKIAKPAKASAVPVRRRFVISSKAIKPDAPKPKAVTPVEVAPKAAPKAASKDAAAS